MLDPSNPSPCSNISPDSSVAGIEKCCHSPGTSMNFKSTISALFFLAISNTSLTAIYLLLRNERRSGASTLFAPLAPVLAYVWNAMPSFALEYRSPIAFRLQAYRCNLECRLPRHQGLRFRLLYLLGLV